MHSVLNEITRLRKGAPVVIDYRNSNRYRLVLSESNGTKTAYYFATPIYNRTSRKMIDLRFYSNGGTIFASGSNANITISDNVRMENADGSCIVNLPQKADFISDRELHCGADVIYPTSNGIAYKGVIKGKGSLTLDIEVDQPFLQVRCNDRCFALMKEKFRPLMVISCIGTLDFSGNVIAPARIEYQKLTDKKYRLTFIPTSPLGHSILFEANLYENKLFQDTTVESKNTSVNNAFGSVGFIGDTDLYGEQWLYSRPDYSRMSEIMDKRIEKVVLHMPKFNKSRVECSAFKVAARFCSFGSNWSNKIVGDVPISDSVSTDGYQSIDITSLLVDKRMRTIQYSEGLILKSKVKGSGFSAIATGDSYFAPQILEVNFR